MSDFAKLIGFDSRLKSVKNEFKIVTLACRSGETKLDAERDG